MRLFHVSEQNDIMEFEPRISDRNDLDKTVGLVWAIYSYYIMPGVPTVKRYFDSENEELYQGLDETASDFFSKRGYVHVWNCNCFDMRLSLGHFAKEGFQVGDTIEDEYLGFGSIGCTTVRNAYQGRHIAVNLVIIGTGYLKEIGMMEAMKRPTPQWIS